MPPQQPTANGPDRALRLVIADDEPRARQALKALFAGAAFGQGRARLGLHVVGEASSGREAVEQASALRPDVVVLDYRMPDMDGLAATAAIKAQWPSMRVVMLTMYPAHRAAALAGGADAFLLKGCPAHLLLQAIVGPADVDGLFDRPASREGV